MVRTPRAANRRRIQKQGRDVVLIRKTTTDRVAGEAWRGKVAVGDPERTTVRAQFKDYRAHEVDGKTVKNTDQRCLIAPADLDDVKPSVADQILDDDGTTFAVMHVGDHRPGTRSFRYELQLRA